MALLIAMALTLISCERNWNLRLRSVAPDGSAELRVYELATTFDSPIRVSLARDGGEEVVLVQECADWNYVGSNAVWADDSQTVAVIACNALIREPTIVGYDLRAQLETSEETTLALLATLIPEGPARFCKGKSTEVLERAAESLRERDGRQSGDKVLPRSRNADRDR